LSFAPVSIRGNDVYRVRPEHGVGLCRHTTGEEKPVALNAAASICPPVLTRDYALYGGLDGKLHIVPLREGVGDNETLLSINKAREILGYDPQHSWRDVVQPTI